MSKYSKFKAWHDQFELDCSAKKVAQEIANLGETSEMNDDIESGKRDRGFVMNAVVSILYADHVAEQQHLETSQSKQQTLRVWHMPQVPAEGDPFYVSVSSIDEAVKVISMLAQYDLYQYENSIKPDYANATGLQMLEDGEWCEWSDDTWSDIDEYMQNQDDQP